MKRARKKGGARSARRHSQKGKVGGQAAIALALKRDKAVEERRTRSRSRSSLFSWQGW